MLISFHTDYYTKKCIECMLVSGRYVIIIQQAV